MPIFWPARLPQKLAITLCIVLLLDVRGLRTSPQGGELAQRLIANLALSLAAKSLFLNRKVRIVSQRRLRDRVLIYLRGLPTLPDESVELTLSVTELARHLNANRSALSRELGRMTDDGIIRIEGKRILLL